MNNLLSPSSNSPTFSVPSTSSTKVILIRHARTTYNEQGRYQGNSDESILTPKAIVLNVKFNLPFGAISTNKIKLGWLVITPIIYCDAIC